MVVIIIAVIGIFFIGFYLAFKFYAWYYKMAQRTVIAPYLPIMQMLGIGNNTPTAPVKKREKDPARGNGASATILFVIMLLFFGVYIAHDNNLDLSFGSNYNTIDSVHHQKALTVSERRTNISPSQLHQTGIVNKKPEKVIEKKSSYQKDYRTFDRLSLNDLAVTDAKEVTSNDYFLKIASYQDYNLMLDRSQQFLQKNYSVWMQEVEIKGVAWYRLFVGTFDDLEINQQIVKFQQQGWKPKKKSKSSVTSQGQLLQIVS